MTEVNIRGIFGKRFLRENFTINLKEEVSIKNIFSKIDSHLNIRYFKKNLKKLPGGITILVNGQPVHSPSKDNISIKDSDEISIIRVMAGG